MPSLFFFSSRRRHTRWPRDWSSDVCSSDLGADLHDGLGLVTDPGLGHKRDAAQGVVDQVGADAGEIYRGHDPERLQLGPWSDSRAKQDGRRGNCPCRKSNAPAPDDLTGSSARDLYADRSTALEHHAAHEAIWTNGQAPAPACRKQVADGGGDTQAFALIHRPRPDAGRFRVIVIRHRREAEGLPGIEVGLLEGNELRGLPAAHRNWPAAAVQWTALVLIVL